MLSVSFVSFQTTAPVLHKRVPLPVRREVNQMAKKKEEKTTEDLRITVNGKIVRLFFMPEPNHEAASFIKKTLISAYALKAV